MEGTFQKLLAEEAIAAADNGRKHFRKVGAFTGGSSHGSCNSLVQFHTAALTAVSKHEQISSLKASRQLRKPLQITPCVLYAVPKTSGKAHIWSGLGRFSYPQSFSTKN